MADTQTTIRRVESFPFDSSSDGYDADGYPVYDRAVGAATLRSVFKQFFSDGVFGTPADALQIAKGDGLAVTIQPGVFIIRGAMGGVYGDAATVTLDSEPPQGNVAYGIMLRYDENENEVGDTNVGRSLSIRVVKGEAASKPTPPSPDKSTPGVMEYRLGYVVVPSGATDLTGATVTNEKGLEACPYAAPFDEIDVSEILADVKNQGSTALTNLLSYFNEYRDVIDAALEGTVATNLQQQIDAIREQIAGFDFDSSVDNVTIEYSQDSAVSDKKLRIKDGAITADKISDGNVRALPSSIGSEGDIAVVGASGLPEWVSRSSQLTAKIWEGNWISETTGISVPGVEGWSVIALATYDKNGLRTIVPLIKIGQHWWVGAAPIVSSATTASAGVTVKQGVAVASVASDGDGLLKAKYQNETQSIVSGIIKVFGVNESGTFDRSRMNVTEVWGVQR